MDITALSMMMNQQSLGVQVGMAVTKMAMDTSEQTAQFMSDMLKTMELSVNPHIGSQIDIRI